MKKINIDIQTIGGYKAIEAWLPNVNSRLAVHRDSRKDEADMTWRDKLRDEKHGWTVTHIVSGVAVNRKMRTKADALRLARAFANRTEWDLIGENGDARDFPRSIRREIIALSETICFRFSL